MKAVTAYPILLTVLLAAVMFPGLLYAGNSRYVPGEVLVKFRDGTTAGEKEQLHATLKAMRQKELRRPNLQRLKLPGDLPVEDAVGIYQNNPNVEYAEPNYIVHALATIPDDPGFSQLWGLNSTGDFDIDAPEAWDVATGSGSVVIAVIDSGLAYAHPDFAGNVWINSAETGGSAGVDDDGNGYVDDFYGWDLIDQDGYPIDLNGHGTHVAGTIGARGDNGLGVTGVMWDVKIKPVRFLGLTGSGSVADAIDAIEYAYENGARIMNNSWGSLYYSRALKDAIEQHADALFVFSAGNTGENNDGTYPVYPASYDSPNIIAVAASDRNDLLAGYSSYGPNSVDLAAPGSSIYSAIPRYAYGPPETVYPPSGAVEDFEGATGSLPQLGWARGGTNSTWAITAGTGITGNSLEDSPDGNYLNNTFAWAGYMTPVVSALKGQRYLLDFDIKGDLESNYDWLDITYSENGTDWDWIDYLTGSSGSEFVHYTADYTSVAETFDSFYFGFRIDSDGSIVGNGVYIDNISMTAQDIFISSYDYASYSGTSMAAPHVAGVAGLLLANNPDLTAQQLKDIILNSVDPVANLSGKVLAGGRLNAFTALSKSPPAAPSDLNAAAASDSAIDLTWSDNSSNEDTFLIERKTGAGDSYVQIASAGPDTNTYSDSGLVASTTYFYRVRSNNTNGSSAYSNEAGDTTMIATTTTTLPVNQGGSGGGGGGGCFIATAADSFL